MKYNFPTPFVTNEYDDGAEPKTLLEQRLVQVSASIRLKPEWQEKIKKPELVAKWQSEAVAQGITEHQFKYVMDELHYLATLSESLIRISPVDNVYEADDLINSKLRGRLLNCIQELEEQTPKDWHPDSGSKILDLVHPSLYCFVNGVTPITSNYINLKETLNFIGKGSKIPCLSMYSASHFELDSDGNVRIHQENDKEFFSKKYQWLPADMWIDEKGRAFFRSYINNLHPVHYKKLYTVLEEIFTLFVPMFNKVLTNLLNPVKPRIEADSDWYESKTEYFKRQKSEKMDVKDNKDDKDEDEENNEYDVEENIKRNGINESDIEEYIDDQEDYEENKKIIIPDIGVFTGVKYYKDYEGKDKPFRTYDLKGKNVQVIVKLANIHLTPESPDYEGGTWHVEGAAGEEIIASGIYYYDTENISESRLAFREDVCEPPYEQNDDRGVKEVYGLENEGALNQNLGYLVTQTNRCIAFPNTYQHQVQPFSLIDKTKPGHRKIIVFFLVNPEHKILSTSNVPPQQGGWKLHSLNFDQGSMDLEEAKKHRKELMKERKFVMDEVTKEHFERPFSLCEH